MDGRDGLCVGQHVHGFERVLFAVFVRRLGLAKEGVSEGKRCLWLVGYDGFLVAFGT